MRVGVLASGRGTNFDALALAQREPGFPARIVLLACDRPEAPVLAKAEGAGIPVLLFDPGTPRGAWTDRGVAALREGLAASGVEAICLAGFMRIIPAEIVRAYAGRILNVHPALLPSFPGTHAQRKALDAGVKVTGCTVHLVDEGVDTGPIVMQAAVPVRENDTEETLSARILEREHEIYPAALRALAEGRILVEGRRARVCASRVAGER
ncbi:MAG: phosphoribosylglycinamide formyltransferase [bacterium]